MRIIDVDPMTSREAQFAIPLIAYFAKLPSSQQVCFASAYHLTAGFLLEKS